MSDRMPWTLAYGIAFPIMQTAIVVSGLMGVVVYKEIAGVKPVLLFFAAGAIVITGAVLLGVYGPGA